MDERLTLAEAAEIANVKPDSLRMAIRREKLTGTLERTPRGPVWYVTRADLDAYLASRRTRTKESNA